ncbi:SOUL family heme-binding protein [Rhodopila sp.]|uniref:SOUL family heme-binding protein n=1 Tax=Rhodopila sp. TaxID=2480087 RepID=UPI003D0B4FCB
MGTIFYYLMTFAEASLGVVGIRGLYEQPHYTVVERLPGSVEIRDYPKRVAAETDDDSGGSVAFPRLFRYITGNNTTGEKIEMTAPVSQRGEKIAMTVPVQSSKAGGVMRFFLPNDVVAKGAPKPLDPNVRIVTVPAEQLAVLRFTGWPDRASVEAHDRLLLQALAKAGKTADGKPFLLTYDAPFTIPFLRRNEVAVDISSPSASGLERSQGRVPAG